jgi:ParB family chromosome partitioning protein
MDTHQEIDLTKIGLNPWNPREKPTGSDFDELVESIKEKGILQPVLVRPSGKDTYELVFGERRYMATLKIAKENGGPEGYSIPAFVRDLTDDQVFDMMMIENLQRKNLTELEEARGYQKYVERNGYDSLAELAGHIGKKLVYIRRKLLVLRLPDKVLSAYSKGEVKYGHLEQLARLKDKKKVFEIFDHISNVPHEVTIQNVKERIDNQLPKLQDARFDIEKAGCLKCEYNSDIQKESFGDDLVDLAKPHCLDPVCFKKKQNNWFQKNWQKTGYHRNFGTNGFRFREDISYDDFQFFFKGPKKQCKECHDFVTLLNLDGSADQQTVCIGDISCHSEVEKVKEKKSTPSGGTDGMTQPKHAWHGEYFRESFYKEWIPKMFENESSSDGKVFDNILRLTLASLLYSNSNIREWFNKKYGEKNDDDYSWIAVSELWKIIENMEIETVSDILKEAAILVSLQTGFGSRTRHLMGVFLGLDLSKDWIITKEYLDKKTIPEILAMGEEFGIFEDDKAKKFLYEVLLKKRGNFKSCKKTELKRVFLESGVDLAGKVPKEILDV